MPAKVLKQEEQGRLIPHMLLLTYEGGVCYTHAETSIHTEKANKAKGVMQTVWGKRMLALLDCL